MIPILYASTETQFTSNGIGRLIDCVSCSVTEERNGIYEMEMQYPINGRHFSDLMNGGIIGVIHDDSGDIQPFDIYKHSAVIDGIVTFNARHISYRLSGICVSPFSANSCADALTAISTNSVQTNPFTFSTDKTISKIYETDFVKSARGILMGEQGSILQAFQGEYKFDKWNVSLLVARGSDSGVTVRYGKNMTGITWDRDDSGCFNAVAPYWTDGTNTVTLPEVYVQPTTPITPIICVPLDMSQMIEGQPTEAQLRTEAVSYLDTKKPWEPVDKITVDFVAMWQTPEYANVASIQRIGLCDTVSIYWTEMGIVAEKAKVVRTVFNVLTERFDEMSVGTVSNEFVAITGEAAGTSIIPITGGGTSADNAADARMNLGLGTSADINAIALQRGTEIPNSSDLNDYSTPGSYYCVSAANAATLGNCPDSAAFKLIVDSAAGNDPNTLAIQFWFSTSTAAVYMRRKYGTSTWSAWNRFMDTATYLPVVEEYAFSNQSLAAQTQFYCYRPNKPGYRCISAYYSTTSSASGVVLLSNPVYVASSSQWVARLYNPNTSAITVGGSVFFVFVPTANLNFV